MFNRATRANWNRAKSRTDRARIAFGLALLGFGSVLLIGALDGMHAHTFMFSTFDFRFGDVGIWLFHCHISFHSAGGMVGRYAVTP
jgi:hypothetical protein